MISVVTLFEGKSLRYIGAGLSGLGGALTGGGSVGAYQGLQQTGYGQQQARLDKNPRDEYEHQKKQPWRMGSKSLLGSIPIVGSVSNVMNQMQLEKQREKLKNSINKK